MSSDNGITGWVDDLRRGESGAAVRLWERYFGEMVRLAASRLPRGSARAFDGEDVALSAFNSFCEGVAAGRFPALSARDELWRLLVVITARKASRYRRDAARAKRGGGRVVGEGDLAGEGGAGFEEVIGSAPTPAFLAEMADNFRRRLDALPDDECRKVALLKLEGHAVAEIAEGLGISHRAIERRLATIRDAWASEAGAP